MAKRFICASFILVIILCSCRQKPDEFHIDLKKGPIYVKQGFAEEDTDTIPGKDWLKLEPEVFEHEDVRIKHTGLPIPKRRFLSPLREKVQEYTILIPFRLKAIDFSRIMIDETFVPGIFLAGIGDNWAIYLNGEEIRAGMHLDGRSNIVTHHSRRDCFFPMDKRLLKQGQNILAFRIIGGPNFKYSGLFYAGPYYIGRYDDIYLAANDIFVPAFGAIFIFIGIYHFLLYLGLRRERYYLFFSLLSIVVGFYSVCTSNTIYQFIYDSGISMRLEYASIFMLVPMLAFFVESLALHRIRLAAKLYFLFCVILAAAIFILPLGFVPDALTLWQATALLATLLVFAVDIVYVPAAGIYREWKQNPGKTSLVRAWGVNLGRSAMGNILIGSLILFLISLADILNSMVFHKTLRLTRFGYLFFALGAAYILIRRYIEMNRALETANANLESTVKQRTAELETQTRLAQTASRAKSDFLANMSHEIRTPMNAILGMAEILMRKNIPQDARSDAENIRQAGNSLLSIINDILDFSKIESGKLELVPAEFSLREMISICLNIIRVRLAETNLYFAVNVDPAIPGRLFGDEIRVRQIVLNLLTNAVKYTPRGHIILTVSAASAAALRFEVADTGIGIKDEDQPKLFKEFNQFDSHRNRGIEGTGLGLAISRNLARMMGGDITMRSRYGEGSVFTAVLPLEPRGEEPFAQVENAAEKPVLFVDRSPLITESAAAALRALGVPCVTADPADGGIPDKLATSAPAGGSAGWAYVIAPADVLEELRPLLAEKYPAAVPVTAAGFGESDLSGYQNLVIDKPLYSATLADLLNGKAASARSEKSGPAFTAPAAKILVVDDVITNLKVVYGLLQPYGAQIHICNNGKKALSMAEKVDYDLIFMDHMMPGMDGVETAAAIRGLEKSKGAPHPVPIIALTANALSGIREMFLENGFQDYLIKPIDIPRLHEAMSTWIPAEKQIPI